MTDRDLVIVSWACYHRVGSRTTALSRWKDIAFMYAVTIQTINAYRELFIRGCGVTSGMADRDHALADYHQDCRATGYRYRAEVVGMLKMLIQFSAGDGKFFIRDCRVASGMADGGRVPAEYSPPCLQGNRPQELE